MSRAILQRSKAFGASPLLSNTCCQPRCLITLPLHNDATTSALTKHPLFTGMHAGDPSSVSNSNTRIRIERYKTDINKPKCTSRKELTFARLMSVSATCGWSSPSNCLRISSDSTVTSCTFTARQLSSQHSAYPFRPHIPPLFEYRHQHLGSIVLALVPI